MMSSYTVENLKVLKGLDAVRKRPGMYIGSTDFEGLHHLVWEIVSNAVDEALAGFAKNIYVSLEENGSIVVEDDGRGIPIEKHTSGLSGVELVFTELHAGGKFSDEVYKNSGGLHGVGSSVVNALSSKLIVNVYKNNKNYQTKFINGGQIEQRTTVVGDSNKKGTRVQFWPDKKIFAQNKFSFDMISERLRETCFLISELKITLEDQITFQKEAFFFKNGIKDFVEFINQGKTLLNKQAALINETQEKINVEIAFQYTDSYSDSIISFVNNIKTKSGGTHELGLKQALVRVFNDFAQQKSIFKNKTHTLDILDIKEGLTLVLSLKVPEFLLEFVGQTKDKLGTQIAKSVVEDICYKQVLLWLNKNQQEANKIINKIKDAFDQRMSTKLSKIESKKSKDASKEKKILSGKLAPAQSKNKAEKELFIVEGESAGGSAKLGRDRKFQAILPLKGKIINAEKTRLIDLLKNNEIVAIISSLGTGIGQDFNINNLEYDKIIIMTDADTDGAHIQILLLTFIFRYMKELIEKGHVYIAQPPLYKISFKNKEAVYAWNENELKQIIENKSNFDLQRYKGLGEMNAQQLWDTTMNPEKRTLIKVKIEDLAIAERRIFTLMGDKIDIRKQWIKNNVHFSLDDDFFINFTDKEDVTNEETR
nr:DNA gyrase subunit B [Mesomycoplasma hyorhinis]